jgi:hypothetical protein
MILAVAALAVQLVNPATPIREAHVYSTANDNSRFDVELRTGPLADNAFPTLVIGDHQLRSSGVGRDSTGQQVYLQVDRDTAQLIAHALAIPMHERAPLDAGMRYTWRFPHEIRRGAPAMVTLVATNTGPTTVGFEIGGRQRGPRDNRFTFTVTRDDGTTLPIKDGWDFGGISYYKKLAPGESAEVSADLESWVALDHPGRYTVTASHETDLSKGGEMPSYPDGAADVWTITPRDQGAIVVR